MQSKQSSMSLTKGRQKNKPDQNKAKQDILKSGDTISNRFIVTKKLGQGGFAQVYQVLLNRRKRDDLEVKQSNNSNNNNNNNNSDGVEDQQRADDFLVLSDALKDIVVDSQYRNGILGKFENDATTNNNNNDKNNNDNNNNNNNNYDNNFIFAMKVEKSSVVTQRLKSEAAILRKLKGMPHFLRFIAFGYCDSFSYMIQTIADFDLHEYTKVREYSGLPTSQICWLAHEMLESIMQFHDIGYIHRDIKPSNFMIKLRNNDNKYVSKSEFDMANNPIPCNSQIYLIDFGVARRFRNPDGSLRPERQIGIPKFRGTNRYCSVNNYLQKDLSRIDDLMSLYYSIIEISCQGGLPWRFVNEKSDTFKIKQRYPYMKYHMLFVGEFKNFINSFYQDLLMMQYQDEPNYEAYLNHLKKCQANINT